MMTKIDQTILTFIIKYIRDKEGEVFPNFELFPYLNTDVQPDLESNNFIDEKGSLIALNANNNSLHGKTISDIRVWNRWLQSKEGNDFNIRRTINAPT